MAPELALDFFIRGLLGLLGVVWPLELGGVLLRVGGLGGLEQEERAGEGVEIGNGACCCRSMSSSMVYSGSSKSSEGTMMDRSGC